jgi:ankyrin repeat protein
VGNNHMPVVDMLLAKGADLKTRDKDGLTLLMLAAAMGRDQMVRVLIDRGADLHALGGEEQFTALHAAIMQEHLAVAQTLLARGAKVNQASASGLTPLMMAVATGSVPMVEAILAQNPDVNARTPQGGSALGGAQQAGMEKIVALLQAKGAKP